MMHYRKRTITKEMYDNATNGYLNSKDYDKIFSVEEMCGYGVYSAMVYEDNGEYYCRFTLGSSCD